MVGTIRTQVALAVFANFSACVCGGSVSVYMWCRVINSPQAPPALAQVRAEGDMRPPGRRLREATKIRLFLHKTPSFLSKLVFFDV